LILLVLCLAVGAYLWFVERGKPAGEAKETAGRRVLAIPPDSVRGFRLDYGDSLVVLEREGRTWRLTSPERALADETAVESLTGFLTELTADRLLPKADVEQGAAGLEKPWVRMTVEIGGDSTIAHHELSFGFQNPTRTAYFAQIDQRPDLALLSSSTIDAAFRRPLSDFRDRHLARFDPDQVLQVDLGSPERTLGLLRVDGRWWIERPHFLANEAQVRGLLVRLSDLQAVELGRGVATAPALAHPALEVSVRGARDSVLATLTIGVVAEAGGEALHLVRSSAEPALASITAEDFMGLALSVVDLRDRHLIDLAGGAIDSVVVVAGERRLAAAAGDSAFAAVFQGLPEWSAMSFASETAQGAAALAPYGLAPPRIVLQAKLRNDGVREVYLGRAEPSGGVFAARPGEPGVLVVSQAVVDAVEEAMAKVQARIGNKAPPPSGP
jgi:hypothetical protein